MLHLLASSTQRNSAWSDCISHWLLYQVALMQGYVACQRASAGALSGSLAPGPPRAVQVHQMNAMVSFKQADEEEDA